MAFATSNVYRDNAGSVNVLRGSWSGTTGDDVGTVTGRGYAVMADFNTNDSTSPGTVIPARISNSSGTWTVTVPYQETVTGGLFSITFR